MVMNDIILNKNYVFYPRNCLESISSVCNVFQNNILYLGTNSGFLSKWDFSDHRKPRLIYVLEDINHANVLSIIHYVIISVNYVVALYGNGQIKQFSSNEGLLTNYTNFYVDISNISINDSENLNILEVSTNLFNPFIYCLGKFSFVHVLDALTLVPLFKLNTRFSSNSITSICFLNNTSTHLDVIIGIGSHGCVRLWTLSKDNLQMPYEDIYENEAKNTALIDCQCLTYCAQNPKIFLMVTPNLFQLQNVATFTKLCQQPTFHDSHDISTKTNHMEEMWLGGAFIDATTLLVWTMPFPKAYIFAILPIGNESIDICCKLEPVMSLNFEDTDQHIYHSNNLSPVYSFTKMTQKTINNEASHKNELMCFYGGRMLVWSITDHDITYSQKRQKNMKAKVIELRYGSANASEQLTKNLIDIGNEDLDCHSNNNSIKAITCSLYLPLYDYYVFGTDQGCICVLQRASLGFLQLFNNYLAEFTKCQYLKHPCPQSNAKTRQRDFEISANNLLNSSAANLENNAKKLGLTKNDKKPLNNMCYPHSFDDRYEPSHFLSINTQGQICLWDLNTFSLAQTLSPHDIPMLYDGNRINNSSSLFRPQTTQYYAFVPLLLPLNEFKHLSLVLSIASNQSVALIDTDKKCVILTISCGIYDVISSLAWFPERFYLLIRCRNGDLRIWDLEHGICDRYIRGTQANTFFELIKHRVIWINPYISTVQTLEIQQAARPQNDQIYKALSKPFMQLNAYTLPIKDNVYGSEQFVSNIVQNLTYDLNYFTKLFSLQNRNDSNMCHKDSGDIYTTRKGSNEIDVTNFDADINDANERIKAIKEKNLLFRQPSLRGNLPLSTDINQLYCETSSPIRKRSRMIHEKRLLLTLLSNMHPWGLSIDLDRKLTSQWEMHIPLISMPKNIVSLDQSSITSYYADNLNFNTNDSSLYQTIKVCQLLTMLEMLKTSFRQEIDHYSQDLNPIGYSNNHIQDVAVSSDIIDKINLSIQLCDDLYNLYLYEYIYTPILLKASSDSKRIVFDIFMNRLLDPCLPLNNAINQILSHLFFPQRFNIQSIFAAKPNTVFDSREAVINSHIKSITTILELCLENLELLSYEQRLLFSNQEIGLTKTGASKDLKKAHSSQNFDYTYSDHSKSPKQSLNPNYKRHQSVQPAPNRIDSNIPPTLHSKEVFESDNLSNKSTYIDSNLSHSTEVLIDPEIVKILCFPFRDYYKQYGCIPGPLLAFMLMGFFGKHIPKFLHPTKNVQSTPDSSMHEKLLAIYSDYFSLQNPKILLLTCNIIWAFIRLPTHTIIKPNKTKKPISSKVTPLPNMSFYSNASASNLNTSFTPLNNISLLSDYLILYDSRLKAISYQVLCLGFSLWEPFLDLSALLLKLLEICVISERLNTEDSVILLASTKECLKNIAFMRPATFITIINKEISKHMLHSQTSSAFQSVHHQFVQHHNITISTVNLPSSGFSAQQSYRNVNAPHTTGHKHGAPASNPNLLISAKEVLFNIIESLIETNPVQIAALLPETIDIYIYCGSNDIHKSKEWEHLLSPFFGYPQLVYSAEKKQLIIGTNKRQIYIYNFKTIKPEICQTPHHDPIITVSYSPDFRNLASFSFPECLLVIWQISAGIFGIGSSQLRLLKSRKLETISALSAHPVYASNEETLVNPNEVTKNATHQDAKNLMIGDSIYENGQNIGTWKDMRIAKIHWLNSRILLLLFSDGTEHKFFL